MTAPSLIILAAGIGSRYGGLKQIEPVGPSGELIVDYSVYDALQAGFGRVVFVISEAIEATFRERVGRRIERQCEVVYVFQRLQDLPPGFALPPGRKKPWGTAHATLSCRDAVSGPFAVINADDFYGRSAYQALGQHLQNLQRREGEVDYCLVGYLLENTLSEHGHVARGVCDVSPDGYLAGIRELTRIEKLGPAARYTEDGETWVEIPAGTVVSMNMWGFTPGLFAELEARFPLFLARNRETIGTAEFLLPVVVGDLVNEGRARVKVLSADARWHGVTYPQDRPAVQQAIRELVEQGVYAGDLWSARS
jgi:hypothetical protein